MDYCAQNGSQDGRRDLDRDLDARRDLDRDVTARHDEYRYIENRISIHRKPNIDISKTEYRYIENRISIYRKPNIDASTYPAPAPARPAAALTPPANPT